MKSVKLMFVPFALFVVTVMAITAFLFMQGNRRFAKEREVTPAMQAMADAIAVGDAQAVARLIEGGFEPDVPIPRIRRNWRGSDSGVVKQTPLMLACEAGALDVARLLIEKGAGLGRDDDGGNTPLIYAVRAGKVEIVSLLLDKGADVNQETSFYDGTMKTQTALAVARSSGNEAVVAALTKAGATR